jgi:transcriptional regulator with GAF, ATPase, and Fis domain
MDTSPMLSSRDRDSSRRGSEQIIGSSLALERVLEQVEYVAQHTSASGSRDNETVVSV